MDEQGWQVPEGAREYTTTRSFYAVMVKDPATFPGVCKQQVVTLAGEVLDEWYVLETSPFGSNLWSRVRAGDFVIYPNDASTNMLQVQYGKDFVRWHPEAFDEWLEVGY